MFSIDVFNECGKNEKKINSFLQTIATNKEKLENALNNCKSKKDAFIINKVNELLNEYNNIENSLKDILLEIKNIHWINEMSDKELNFHFPANKEDPIFLDAQSKANDRIAELENNVNKRLTTETKLLKDTNKELIIKFAEETSLSNKLQDLIKSNRSYNIFNKHKRINYKTYNESKDILDNIKRLSKYQLKTGKQRPMSVAEANKQIEVIYKNSEKLKSLSESNNLNGQDKVAIKKVCNIFDKEVLRLNRSLNHTLALHTPPLSVAMSFPLPAYSEQPNENEVTLMKTDINGTYVSNNNSANNNLASINNRPIERRSNQDTTFHNVSRPNAPGM